MPIIGLTDRGAAFPRIGTLRKGAPKVSERQPGADLKDRFRLDTQDAEVAAAFERAYGDAPNNIRVMLPYATVAENFDTWQEEWSAGSLKHRCDSRTCVRWLAPDGTYHDDPKPCPGGCKPAGRLQVWIPELQRAGVILVPTTSIWDIIELQSNLDAAQAMRGDLRGIPFILRRAPRKISTPGSDGKRRRLEKWLLSIEPAPDWVRLQLAATARAALPANEQLLLSAPIIDEDTGELFDEEVEEEDCEHLRNELKSLRAFLKEIGGAPWALTQKQVLAMSCDQLRTEIEATQAAVDSAASAPEEESSIVEGETQ